MKLNQILIPISDFQKSFEFYERLGLDVIVKTEVYARFIVPGNNATLSIQVRENIKPNTVEICFEVDDVDKKVNELKLKGFTFAMEPVTQAWKWREAHLKDPDGNTLLIYHAGEHRINPENKIKNGRNT